MAALRRRSALIEHSTALPVRNSALIAAPRRGRTTEGFTSSSNLTIISASAAGTDSTFSTMATQTDIPGTGRVIDKYVFQPAGRKIEAFIGGIVRRMSTRKVRRRESAALLADDLMIATPFGQGDVAPPYTMSRGSRPLPQIPESSVATHPTVTPWLAQSSAFSTFNEQSERSYNGSEGPYSLSPPAPTAPSPPFYYYGQVNDNLSIPAPVSYTTPSQPTYNHERDISNIYTSPPMINAQAPAPSVANTSGGQWWQQQNEAPLVVIAPPAYDVTDLPPVSQVATSSGQVSGASPPMNEPTPSSSSTSSTGKLMTFCMNDEHVYAPTELNYEKALNLAQSFFPSLASTPRESIAFSFDTVMNTETEGGSPTPSRLVRVVPAVWAYLCQRREDREIVHITVMRHPSPSSHRNYDFEPSPGSTRDPKNSLAFAPDALSSADVKLMMFAYEGELVYVPSAPDYELAITIAQSAFPMLSHVDREDIVFSVKSRLSCGTTKPIRIPREAWSCLSPTLPNDAIIEISLAAPSAAIECYF